MKFIALMTIIYQFSSFALGQSECYVGPRYPHYGFADNGIYRYQLDGRTIKKKWENSSYFITDYQDSVHELYFCNAPITPEALIDFEMPLDSIKMGSPRIVIYANAGTERLEIQIDENFHVKIHSYIYMIKSSGIEILLDLMPDDLKENWMLDSKVLKTWKGH